MKQFLSSFALAGFAALGLSAASPASAQTACVGGSTLNGTFGILVGGTAVSGGSKFLTGVLNFNGACGFSGEVSYGLNGAVNYFAGASGTYNTSPDGTIAIALNVAGVPGTQTYQVGYAPNSNEALGIETDGEIATIDLQAQTIPRSNIVYGLGSLKGTYSVECYGVGPSYSDLNYVTFDGAGNLSGSDYYNNSGNQGAAAPYTGSFAVKGDGVFGGTLYGSFNVFQYIGSIDNNGNEIQFIYFQTGVGTNGGTGAITTCTGKK